MRIANRSIPALTMIMLLMYGCQKDTPPQSIESTLADKIWSLEKHSTPTVTYNYGGLPTFSFRLTSNSKNYSDSDGITGSYTIIGQTTDIQLRINSNGRVIDAYQVALLEKDRLILQYTKNNILNTFYFLVRP